MRWSLRAGLAGAAALGLLGLAVCGCSSAGENPSSGAQAVPDTSPQQATPRDEHVADSTGDAAADHHHHAGGGHGAHGGGHPHGGAGDAHGHGRDRGNRHDRQERTEHLGELVRDFAVLDNTGKTFRLGTLRRADGNKGKIAVLTFWCTTCHSCRDIEKEFDEKAKKYAGEGVSFLMVDSNFSDNMQRVNRFLEQKGLSFTVLMDPRSEIARYFGAKFTTTTAVIDAEGRLRYYGAFAKAEDAVRNLLAGEEVAVAESSGGG